MGQTTRQNPHPFQVRGLDPIKGIDGHLDETAWPDNKELCSVRRFEDDLEDEHGLLLHLGPDRWVFSYEPGEEDDEPLFRLSLHRFQEGEYVSITEHGGEQRTFQVVAVSDYVPV